MTETFKVECRRDPERDWEVHGTYVAWFGPIDGGFSLEAATRTVDYLQTYGWETRLVPYKPTWREREALRFYSGEYEHLPWTQLGWFKSVVMTNHAPHVCKADPSKVAFTEDDAKGEANRQTIMKPGRFLTKFFSDVLTADEISALANKYVARTQPGTLKFAHTADEIEQVYIKGPSSCMSHSACGYESPYHPVRVYAAGDLAVAYIDRGGVTARALCWPEKKLYGRVYGDAERLEPALSALGYTQGHMNGARLVRDEFDDGRFVCPYIDAGLTGSAGGSNVEDCGDFLRIDDDGEMSADDTEGCCAAPGYCCDCCGDRFPRDSMSHVLNEGDWCEACIENHAVWSDGQEDWLHQRSATHLEHADDWVSDSYFERHGGYWCEGLQSNMLPDDSKPVEMAGDVIWSTVYFEEHGFECDETGIRYPRTEGHELPDGTWLHVAVWEAQQAAAGIITELARSQFEAAGQLRFDLEVA